MLDNQILEVENVFMLKSRGLVVTGAYDDKTSPPFKVGDQVIVLRKIGPNHVTVIDGIEFFRQLLAEGGKKLISIYLRGLTKNEVERGDVICLIATPCVA